MDRFARAVPLAIWVVLASSLGTALAQETVEVTPWTAAEFGGEGGDALALEKITPPGAVVLLNPQGETCTLRVPMTLGEKVRLRGAPVGDQQAVCEVLRVSATEAPSAIFTFACLNQTPSAERKCPP
jgi:hypothetical protein